MERLGVALDAASELRMIPATQVLGRARGIAERPPQAGRRGDEQLRGDRERPSPAVQAPRLLRRLQVGESKPHGVEAERVDRVANVKAGKDVVSGKEMRSGGEL